MYPKPLPNLRSFQSPYVTET